MDFSNITSNIPLAASIVLALLGWLLEFIGVCVIQGKSRDPQYAWWIVFYQLAVNGWFIFSVLSNAIPSNRLALIVLIGIAVSNVMQLVNLFLQVKYFNDSKDGENLFVAGGIFSSLVYFAWIFLLGTDYDPVYGAAPTGSAGVRAPAANAGLTASHQPGTTVTGASVLAAANPGGAGTTAVPMPQDFVCKARALYSYKANPEDPNELSFEKNEVLEIIDNKGKWWQARRRLPDGSVIIGIAPSNYLAVV